MNEAYNPNTEELFHVAGDEDTGVSADVKLTKTALDRPQIRYDGKYGNFVIGTELYEMNGELALHIICPKCRKALWIKSSKKQMDWNPEDGISVEPFECTWETDESDQRRMEFGLGLCRWRAAIDNNRAKDA